MRDLDIRQALISDLRKRHNGEAETRIVEELGLAQGISRVDVAVINGAFNGFEIKSNRDRLDRLPHQRDVYCRFFDTMTIVVGDKHIQRARIEIPKWWGIVEARDLSGLIHLRPVRKARLNKRIDPHAVVQLLWKSEAISILAEFGIMEKHSRASAWIALTKIFGCGELCQRVRSAIKARGDWRSGPTPFRCGDLSRSAATVQRSQANLHWLLSRKFQHLPR